MQFRLGLVIAVMLVEGVACTSSASSPNLPPLPPPDHVPSAMEYLWLYYDTPDHSSVFENYRPIDFQRFSARAGARFKLELTAMKSATEWVPDPTKQIDGVVYEGIANMDGSMAWTVLARASSHDGVLELSGTSTRDDAIHLLGVEADPASYDDSLSPAVEYVENLTCNAGSHDHCTIAAQPGEACTVMPNTCDGPFQACITPDGACGNTGTCQREDVLCSQAPPRVCTCEGHGFPNRCQANQARENVRHEGDCP